MPYRNLVEEEFKGVDPDLERLSAMGDRVTPIIEGALKGDNAAK